MNQSEDPILYIASMKGQLRLSKTGEWFHDGEPFTNQNLIDFFNRSVVWNEEAQEYYVRVGKGWASFDCEDTAYFVTAIDDSSSPWTVRLSDKTMEPLRPDTLVTGSEDQFYCKVKGDHLARFTRAAHQTLIEHAIDEQTITIDGSNFQVETIER